MSSQEKEHLTKVFSLTESVLVNVFNAFVNSLLLNPEQRGIYFA